MQSGMPQFMILEMKLCMCDVPKDVNSLGAVQKLSMNYSVHNISSGLTPESQTQILCKVKAITMRSTS